MKNILNWLKSNNWFRFILSIYLILAGSIVIAGYLPQVSTIRPDDRLLFGLFEISLIDDVTHGLTALAFLVALLSPSRSLGLLALTAFGHYYALDAIFHLINGLFDGGSYISDILLNFPHVIISSTMLSFAYISKNK
jgi:hypothetical protein